MFTAPRQLTASVLALTLALPAAAAEKKARPADEAPLAPAAKLTAEPEPSSPPAKTSTPAQAPSKASAPVQAPSKASAPAVPTLDAPAREPEPFIRGHRYAYVAGGALLLGGVGFGYFSRGEAKRAQSLESAREARAALDRARTASATANVMYGVAGLTLAYGLLLELLPEPAADAASLTYHF
ncbi:hypothetical protein [Hyalangium rubrum]|uniref:Uncharacterized protein n=1 Tax=Hyalangium rubrum TaxID=3103134 RepID=A0ABU5HBS7_9BACT|nr:hypothetical protein [Hyalangium sp. s54d21]MDY7230716.1 hypothetical protein [Hyalangium sp. s54d21]